MNPLLEWLLLPGWRFRAARKIKIDDFSHLQSNVDEGKFAFRRGERVKVELEGSAILRKRHEVPRTSRKRTARILEIKAQALQSSIGVELSSAFSRIERGPKHDIYEQTLVRSADLDKLKTITRQTGAELQQVSIDINGNLHEVYQNLSRQKGAWAWWNVALILVVAGLGWTRFQYQIEQRSLVDEKGSINQEIILTQNRLEERGAASAAAAQIDADLAILQETFLSDTRSPDLISALSTTLPDHSWLSMLQISDGEIRIRGTTHDEVAQLVDLMSEVDWIEAIELASPITRDRARGTQSYELILTLGTL